MNNESIEELINPKAFAQLEMLLEKIGIARSEFSGFALDVEAANKAISGSKAPKDFEAASNKATDAMSKLVSAQSKVEAAEVSLRNARKKSIDDFERKIQKELALQERKSQQSVKQTEMERLAEIKLDQDRKKAFDRYEAAAARKRALDEKAASDIQKNSRPYALLSNTLEDLRRKAQDTAIVFGENSEEFKKAAKTVIELDSRLKAIDSVLGKNQRNVGNYKSGFNGLSSSINQITREFPAFTFSVQTGFLALSNNIPIFFDQIQQTQKEIKALRAEGQKVPGLFKQLASSIFSFGTALSLLVTFFPVYGKEIGEFFSSLFKGTEQINAATKTINTLGEAVKGTEFLKAAKDVNELRINIQLAKEGLLDKDKVLKQYNESIGKTTGQVSSLDAAEQELTKNGSNYIRVTLLKAAAQLALEEAAKSAFEAETIRSQGQKDLSNTGAPGDKKVSNLSFGQRIEAAFTQDANLTKKLIKQRTAELSGAADSNQKTLLQIAEKFQRDAAELSQKSGFADFFGGDLDKKGKTKVDTSEFDLQRARLERQRDTAKEMVDTETNTLDLRLSALKKYISASERLTDIDYKSEVKKAQGNADKILFLQEQNVTDRSKVQIEGRKLEAKINEDAEKALTKLLKDGLKAYEDAENKKVDILRVAIVEQRELLGSLADEALKGAAEQYAKGILNEKQYADTRLEIQRQYTLDLISEEIKGVQKIIDLKKAAGLDTAADEKALAELRKKLSKETAAQEISDLEKIAEREKEIRAKRKELLIEVSDLGINLINGVFENQKNKIQKEIDLRDKQKQIDIENANASVGTQQEKADKIAIIEARAAAQRQVLEQQQREVDQRKARFEKAVSIARIIANTAEGVTKALGSLNVPLAILIGAIGAVQVATVLATPIPKYKDGTNSSAGGYALTDEEGPEGYITPSGDAFLGSDKPNIKKLQAGTKVIPHKTLRKMFAKPELSNTFIGPGNVDLSPLIKEYKNSTKELKKAFSSGKTSTTVITKSGWRHTQGKMAELSEYVKRNFN